MRLPAASPRIRLIAWLVAAPFLLFAVYAGLFGVLCLCDRLNYYDFIEVVPAKAPTAAQPVRGTAWEYVYWQAGPQWLQHHGNAVVELCAQPGCALLARWSRHAAHDDDPLWVVLRDQAMPRLGRHARYDRLTFTQSDQEGLYQLTLTRSDQVLDYEFVPPSDLSRVVE